MDISNNVAAEDASTKNANWGTLVIVLIVVIVGVVVALVVKNTKPVPAPTAISAPLSSAPGGSVQ